MSSKNEFAKDLDRFGEERRYVAIGTDLNWESLRAVHWILPYGCQLNCKSCGRRSMSQLISFTYSSKHRYLLMTARISIRNIVCSNSAFWQENEGSPGLGSAFYLEG